MSFQNLDPVLNTPLRLAIVSILIKLKEADFSYLQERTEATQGNLSHSLKKLEDEQYITIEKRLKGRYPQTIVILTKKGRKAFEDYVDNIKQYLHLK